MVVGCVSFSERSDLFREPFTLRLSEMKLFPAVLVSLLLITSPLPAQNLVPNPGFETFSGCPTASCEWYRASNWSSVNNFIGCNSGNSGSPDYFNACGATFFNFPLTLNARVNPLSGDAVMGLSTWLNFRPNFREYLSVQLTTPLVAGTDYTLRFFYTNGQPDPGVGYGGQGTQLGAHFSVGALGQTGAAPILLTPTYESVGTVFSQTWQLVVFNFTATANFTHLTFGNFRNDAATTVQQFASPSTPGFTYAYYYFDDISVEEDFVLNAPEVNLEIQKTAQGLNLFGYAGQPMARMQVERSADGEYFEPLTRMDLEAGFSWLDAFPFSGENYYRVRFVTSGGEEGISAVVNARWEDEVRWTIGPNPVNAEKQVVIRHNNPDQQQVHIRLLDVQGRTISTWKWEAAREIRLDLAAVPAGVYMLELTDGRERKLERLTLKE